MDEIIEDLREVATVPCLPSDAAMALASQAVRRLEECRALLERLAAGEPAPEGHTFQSWAGELLK